MKKRIILSAILLSLMISGCNKKDDSSSDLSNDNKISAISSSSSTNSVEVILPPDAVDFILFVNSIVIDEKAGIYIEEAWDMYEALGDNWNYPQVSEAYYKLIYLESLYNDYIDIYNEALNFIEKVEEIPFLLGLNDEVYILSAEAEYENLSEEAKGILGVTEAYERLLKAREDYDSLYLQSIEEERQENIDNFISLVNKIPSIEKLTVDDEDKINEALAAYEILSDELKEENSIVEAYSKLLELQDKYKELLDIVITLDANGGTCDVETLEIVAKEAIGTLPTPIRDNYKFVGWYTALEDGEEVTSTSTFKESTTIYAIWNEIVDITITLDANGGVCAKETITSTNAQVIGTLPTPTRDGYTFLGWYTALEDGEEVTSTSTFKESTTIYAIWNEIVDITITLDANGGVCAKEAITSTNVQAVGTLPTPTREGYNFLGWYTALEGGDKVNSSTLFEEDTTIYALWREKSETPYTSRVVTNTNAAWFKYYLNWEDEAYDIESIHSISSIKHSNGEITFSHTLDTQTINNEANLLQYGLAFKNAQFTIEGTYEFTVTIKTVLGDFYSITTSFEGINGGEAVVVSTESKEVESLIITFDANGGNCNTSSSSVISGTTLSSLPNATLEGYKFSGWYTDPVDGERVTLSTTFTEETTLYAHFEETTDDDTSDIIELEGAYFEAYAADHCRIFWDPSILATVSNSLTYTVVINYGGTDYSGRVIDYLNNWGPQKGNTGIAFYRETCPVNFQTDSYTVTLTIVVDGITYGCTLTH